MKKGKRITWKKGRWAESTITGRLAVIFWGRVSREIFSFLRRVHRNSVIDASRGLIVQRYSA